MAQITATQLKRALVRHLGLTDSRFFLESDGGRIIGSVVAPQFRGKRGLARQRMIWRALEIAFGTSALDHVGSILPYTPEEWDVDLESVASHRRSRKPRAAFSNG